MAPKGAQKRDAAATKKAPPAKKNRVDVAGKTCDVDPLQTDIIGVIEHSDDLPQKCRSMLIAGLRGSLNTPSDERHQVQSIIVGMLEEVIVARQERLEKQLDAAKATESSTADMQKSLMDKLNEAEGNVAEKTSILEEKRQANGGAQDKLAAAQAAYAEKQALQISGDAVMKEKQADKVSIEQAIEKDLTAIQNCTGGCDDLLPVISKLCSDESLVKALPATCARPLAERGDFDAMVLSQLETSLKDTLTNLTNAVEAEQGGVKERAEAVQAALAKMQEEAACKSKAEEEQSAAEAVRLEAVAVVDAIKKDIAEHQPNAHGAVTARETCAAELETFKQNIRMPFEQRRDAKAGVVSPEATSVDAVPLQETSPQAKDGSPREAALSPAAKGLAVIEDDQGAAATAGGA